MQSDCNGQQSKTDDMFSRGYLRPRACCVTRHLLPHGDQLLDDRPSTDVYRCQLLSKVEDTERYLSGARTRQDAGSRTLRQGQ